MKTQRLTEVALLTTLALILFIVELHIPNPIPIHGVKLGLANVITVYAVYHYCAREVLAIVLSRITLGAIFSGNLMAFAYSLAGGLLCLVGMLLLRRILSEKHIWLCSVFGAVLHNIGQIAVAILITGTPLLIGYLPVLLLSGCAAGAFTGICAQLVVRRIGRLKYIEK